MKKLIIFFIFLFIFCIADDSCIGSPKHCPYVFNLEGLYNATGGKDLEIKGLFGSKYYYRPCYPLLNEYCQTIADGYPAFCKLDRKKIPQYHDCGSTNETYWYPLDDECKSGFKLLFKGGELNRMTDIEFICDKNIDIGYPELAIPHEYPKYFYHFKWVTSYACPY